MPVKNITEVGRFSTALAVMFLSVKSKTSRTLVALFPFVPVVFAWERRRLDEHAFSGRFSALPTETETDRTTL